MLGVDRNAVPPDPNSVTSAARGRRRQPERENTTGQMHSLFETTAAAVYLSICIHNVKRSATLACELFTDATAFAVLGL